MSIFDGFLSLGKKVMGSADEPQKQEGLVSPLMSELELDISDEEILGAIKALERDWAPFEETLSQQREENIRFWKGKQSEVGLSEHNLDLWKGKELDNALFEATETFLAQATKTNPEPVITSPSNNESVTQFCKSLKDILVYDADRSRMKLKIKRSVRNWDLARSGVIQVIFDEEENRIDLKVIRPQDLILQKNAVIEDGFYCGSMLAWRRENSARELIKMFPKEEQFLKAKVDDKLETRLGYLEVWTNEYRCYRMEDKILGKSKNPHFNYSKEEVGEYNEETKEVEKKEGTPLNHFRKPKIPFLFLSVYNLGQHPVDETTLFEQCIPYQRIIDRRMRQISTNIDDINNGYKGDPAYFTEDTLQEAIQAVREGDGVLCPPGSLVKEQGTALPSDVFQNLLDTRQRLKDVYGVTGLTPSGIRGEDTVRGKILTKGADGDRIGSGVIEYVEQFADAIFNYCVQMIYVYYQKDELVRILGDEKASEFLGLQAYMVDKDVLVSVKEGSLIPKDDLTKRNEAVDMWAAQSTDPISYFEALDKGDPEEAAYKLFLWTNDKARYFAEFGGRQIAPAFQPPETPPPEAMGAPPIPPDTQVPGQDVASDAPNLLGNVPVQ